jgi:hypothetical protein
MNMLSETSWVERVRTPLELVEHRRRSCRKRHSGRTQRRAKVPLQRLRRTYAAYSKADRTANRGVAVERGGTSHSNWIENQTCNANNQEHYRPESRTVRVMASDKSKRIWTEADTQAAIEAVRRCRKEAGKLQMRAPINGPEYLIITRLIRAIDNVATVLTVQPDLFHASPPSHPQVGQRRCSKRAKRAPRPRTRTREPGCLWFDTLA